MGHLWPSLSAVSSGAKAGPFGEARLAQPVATADADYVTIVADGLHNAFPALVKLPGGTLLMMYRRGTAHVNNKGDIYKRTSTDGGATWSGPTLVYSHATLDARDPALSLLSDGRIALTVFLADATTGASQLNGLRLMFSSDLGATWGAPITPADPFTGWASCSGPIVEFQGALLWPIQGRMTGDAFGSSTLMRSTDNGATWTPRSTVVVNGQTASKNIAEPNLLVTADGGLLFVTRNSTDKVIDVRKSTTDWQTFGAVIASFAGDGSPHMVRLTSGAIFVTTREAVNGLAMFNYSFDNGATWPALLPLDNGVASTYLEMTYASMVEIATGIVACVTGNENIGQTLSDLYCRYIFERPGTSPTGVVASAAGITNRRPMAHVYHDAAQSVTSGTSLALAFNQERYDKGALHSKTVNNTRLTVPPGGAGIWEFAGAAEFAASSAGSYRGLWVRLNGATTIGYDNKAPAGASVGTRVNVVGEYFLQPGDYIELMAAQDSGGALNVNSATNFSPSLRMSRKGPA